MQIAKHMEAIFLAALALVSASSLADAAVPAPRALAPVAQLVHPGAAMAVVTITGKRLSAAQKAALGNY